MDFFDEETYEDQLSSRWDDLEKYQMDDTSFVSGGLNVPEKKNSRSKKKKKDQFGFEDEMMF